jgi:hypothetical protein
LKLGETRAPSKVVVRWKNPGGLVVYVKNIIDKPVGRNSNGNGGNNMDWNKR